MVAASNGAWPLKAVATALGIPVREARRLHGGCLAEVHRCVLADDRVVAAKLGEGLACEGWMLRFLAERGPLPVPDVLHSDDALLILSFLPGSTGLGDARAERHAAELFAALHHVTAPAFGLERDTVIGPLRQPNPWTRSWRDFFRDQRLFHMARLALDAGRLPVEAMRRIEIVAARLDAWLDGSEKPALLHGDLWSGNILSAEGRVTGAIDPAIYFGDAEIELAFGTLFGPFETAFFDRYREIRPIRPGFFETRRHLYLLYPLLVHVRLFGASYLGQLDATLRRLGA